MPNKIRPMHLALISVYLTLVSLAAAQGGRLDLKMEEVMTAKELKDSGVSELTVAQRKELDAWLNRYTENMIKIIAQARAAPTVPPTPATRANGSSPCSPAVESTITGDFNGWDGETMFKLDNGQIWEQAEYDYMYSYQYRPDVTIYQTTSGCRMKVQDEDETILVKRIR